MSLFRQVANFVSDYDEITFSRISDKTGALSLSVSVISGPAVVENLKTGPVVSIQNGARIVRTPPITFVSSGNIEDTIFCKGADGSFFNLGGKFNEGA